MGANPHPSPSKDVVVGYGLFVQEAYAMFDANKDKINPPPTKNFPKGWQLFETIQMTAADNTEFIGFFARNRTDSNAYVVAFRGSRTLADYSVDVDTYLVPFDNRKPNEKVLRGVHEFYTTMTVMRPDKEARRPFRESISALSAAPTNSMVATGHSLGGWLATLATFELANIGVFNPPIYTFASPKIGNHDFVTSFDRVVRNSYRIINIQDKARNYPSGDDYEHVKGEWPIDGKNKVQNTDLCQHYLGTYLYLLSGDKNYVDPTCKL